MQKLLNPDIVPPEPHFRYRDPESGFIAVAQTYPEWIRIEHDHLRGNGRPVPPNLSQIMEEQLCATLPAGWCEEYDPNRVEPITRLHKGDILDGMKVFARWGLKNRPVVSQTEAERRAAICANCYLNVNIVGCQSCHNIVEELTQGFSSSRDQNLIACAVCKCLLKAKIHFPLDILETTDSDWKQRNYPSFCWLKKGGPNYAGNKTLPSGLGP